MNSWKFILLFHNLSVSEPIGNDIIKIVPINDPLVEDIRKRSEEFCQFIDNFKDQFGRPSYPSLLFCQTDKKPDIESLISFRNALAISSIVKSWTSVLSGGRLEHFKFSNYFDFYPYSLSDDEKYLIAQTPSVMSLDEEVKEFHGQPSPDIAKAPFERNFYYTSLFNSLLEKWVEYFINKRSRKWELISLFRSLQMAYRASSMPFGNQGTIHDYGSNLSLWVSAFEILVHPKVQNVGVDDVIQLLGDIYFCSKNLKQKRYRIIISKKNKKKIKSLTLVQKTYFEMYCTRCKFLHGNPVNLKMLFPNGNTKFPPLNFCAPVIYKYVLEKILGLNKKYNLPEDLEIIRRMSQRNNEVALLNMRKEIK